MFDIFAPCPYLNLSLKEPVLIQSNTSLALGTAAYVFMQQRKYVYVILQNPVCLQREKKKKKCLICDTTQVF